MAERKGFYPQCQRDQVEPGQQEALRIKPVGLNRW
jgi:hypothetical protein